jgi:DNA-binding CsgD family transcriptional regulator
MPLQITPSERHALQLLANGNTTNDVATGLGIGELETEVLLAKLFAELGAASQAQAIAAAHKRGLVSCEPDSRLSACDAHVSLTGNTLARRWCVDAGTITPGE